MPDYGTAFEEIGLDDLNPIELPTPTQAQVEQLLAELAIQRRDHRKTAALLSVTMESLRTSEMELAAERARSKQWRAIAKAREVEHG